MKRAASEELIDYDKIVSDLNKYFRSKKWFICYDCNELIIDEGWVNPSQRRNMAINSRSVPIVFFPVHIVVKNTVQR